MSKKSRESKQMPWSEAAKINLRAFRLLYSRMPKMVVTRLALVVWDSLTPYVGIYLSALLISELAGARDISVLTRLVVITLVSSAVISLVSALAGKMKEAEEVTFWANIQQIFSDKLLSMDYVDVDDPKTHQLLSTIRQNENGGGWGLFRVADNIETLLSSLMSLFGGISLTFSLFTRRVPDSAGAYTVLNNPLFIVLIVAVMLAITYFSPMLSNKADSYYAKNSSNHNLANRLFGFFGFLGYISEDAADVRIYRQDKFCDKYNNDKTGTFSSNGMFAKFARGPMGLYNAASAAVSVIFTGVVYAFVCVKALAGAFGIGSVTQYVSSISRLSGSVSALIRVSGEMRNNAPFMKLIFEFIDIPNNMYQGSLTVEKRRDRDYEIEFRDVSFKYPGSDSYSLRHVSMKFKVGERLAVVGQNGSGKTTFIKLLCRLYDPTEGEILLNGINIRKYSYREYMSVFSVVFQDFALLAYRLGENVAAGSSYDGERVKKCLTDAGFGERLEKMPNGLETYLYKRFSEKGVDISGGEAQKIAIARSLYKDSPFIILDEPTAALDPVAEADIYTKFNEIVGDKTAIYISHRLSSCRFCDDIAVFDKGQVVEQGSHDDLISNPEGKYHELWYAQAQYYAEDEAVSMLYQ
ncbi:MAG: ABC transporter ATP-binding protein [Eubacteriales bacterium]